MRNPEELGDDALNGKLDEIQLAISASADPQTRAYLEGLLGQIRSSLAKRLDEGLQAGEQKPHFDFGQTARQQRQAYQQPKPYRPPVELAVPEEPAHQDDHGPQGHDYSKMPLYSEWLAENLGLKAPFEQYGLYLAGLLGVRAFMRRGACARYLRSLGEVGQAAASAAASRSWWGAGPHRWASPASQFASMHAANHLRARGVAALVAYPGAWVLFRNLCNR